MISSVLALAMMAGMQPTDTTRPAREAFTACLRTYVDRSVTAHMPPADFATGYPTQCTTQEQSFRDAVIRRETASRASRADATQSATDEISEARTNFSERFDMMQPETPAAAPVAATASAAPAATAPSSATASATPAATPAAATTTPH